MELQCWAAFQMTGNWIAIPNLYFYEIDQEVFNLFPSEVGATAKLKIVSRICDDKKLGNRILRYSEYFQHNFFCIKLFWRQIWYSDEKFLSDVITRNSDRGSNKMKRIVLIMIFCTVCFFSNASKGHYITRLVGILGPSTIWQIEAQEMRFFMLYWFWMYVSVFIFKKI